MQKREQVRPCLSDKANLRQSEKNPGGAPENAEKSKLNTLCEAEETITVQKRTKCTE